MNTIMSLLIASYIASFTLSKILSIIGQKKELPERKIGESKGRID